MIDQKLTDEIRQWLDSPEEQRSLEAGAAMLLRLNGNRFMQARLLRSRNFAKLEYELAKHLRIRLKGLTVREVARMERDALPRIEESMALGAPVTATDADHPEARLRGRRADHDSLPESIRALYDRGGELYFKMKQLFETLKGMEDATPCDRHELLCQLAELDRAYRDGWNTYDTWSAAANGEVAAQDPGPRSTPPTAQEVQAARKYLSTNKPRLAAAGGEAADALRTRMQQCVDLLLSASQGFDADYRAELEELGLKFDKG